MNRLRAPSLAACVALLAFTGCGGGSDKEDAEGVVRDITEATNEKDGGKFCGLVSEQLLEQSTGAQGDRAKDACEKQIDSGKTVRVKLAKIVKTEINGDKATVTAELEQSGRKRPQVFNLTKEDGDFKLAGARE